MKNNDLVSIIIPCYNQAQYLEKAVESAVHQTYPNIEIIIVNDGSFDNTQEIALTLLEKYPKIIRLITQENSGLPGARNRGVKESLGDYILPLDADDSIDKSMVEKSVKELINNNTDIISTDGQCFGKENYIIRPIEFPECNILYCNCWVVASLYRRNVWVETSGYKESMNGGYEDWEFWINAYKHGFKFQRYPEILFFYRTKDDSMYTAAQDNDTYLKSKIIMNHQALYTMPQVQEAIIAIEEMEKLADLYFYYDKKISVDEKIWITEVGNYINENPLRMKQIVEIHEKKVGLYSLDILKDDMSLEKLYQDLDVAFLFFYAPMRYEVTFLINSSLAWEKKNGIINALGTTFPFVSMSERENINTQLIAYQRLHKYLTKTSYEKDLFIKQQKLKIDTQNRAIKDKNNKMDLLMNAIQVITKYSILKNPVKKYKSYKRMLSIYQKLSRAY